MTETVTFEQAMIHAFVHTGLMKRYIGPMQEERMREMITERQLRTIDDLRNWLQMGEGMSPKLARALLNCMPPRDKESFGKYKTLTHLADGGMGSVWLCANEQNKLVVLKTLKGNLSTQSDEFGLRFEREAKIMETLKHDNTVWCLDADKAPDGTHFMVLEFIESGDLKDLTEQFTRLTEALSLCLFYQITCGLAVADRLKLIHRDIKPANIFICKNGTAKLADFGIARSTEENRTMLTMQGALVGSPLYMSPEQVFADSDLDIRSDIYALGCVLYYMLTGNPPYTSTGHLQEVLHMHCEAPIPDVRDARPEVSEATQNIIAKCMAKDKSDRFDNPEAMLADVAAAIKSLGLDISSIETEFGPASPSAQKASSDLIAAMRAQIPEETIAQNLNILNTGNANSEDATIATANFGGGDDATIAQDLSGMNDDMTIAQDFGAAAGADAEATIAADWNAETQTGGTSRIDRDAATIAGGTSIDAEAETVRQSASNVTPNDFVDTLLAGASPDGRPATDVTLAEKPANDQKLDGDLQSGMNCPWVNLMPSNPGEPMSFMLYAKNDLLMGKLRDAPIDICLRNYPVPIHKAACQRISRQHVRVTYDPQSKTVSTMDVGSGNGTLFEGMALPPNKPQSIPLGGKGHLLIADAVELEVEAKACTSIPTYLLQGTDPSSKANLFGIDTHNAADCVVLSRPSNRPELTYAMVLRQCSVGGSQSNIQINGVGDDTLYVFALYNGYWIWRTGADEQTWYPLQPETKFDIANRQLIARPGAYQDFH